MYTESKCGVKINTKRTRYLSQERGVRQVCCLSPTLFNIYINELALSLERSAAPGLALHDSQIRCLLYADDLVLLSPTKHGLQQNLDLLEQYWQSWALTVNLKKTNIMIFQKRSRSQGTEHIFTLGTNQITHTSHYNYLGLKITSTGNFNHAVNELRDKARRAFYAIKRQCPIEIPIRIWLKIVESVIEPIALYGSEVWGPLTNPSQDLTKWEKHPIETLHAELCKNILHVHRHTTNNACRAELGKYPLITKIQKRAIKFWKHLKLSDPQSYHYKALQYQEMSKESKPFLQLIQSFSPDASLTSTDALNHNIRTNQITAQIKQICVCPSLSSACVRWVCIWSTCFSVSYLTLWTDTLPYCTLSLGTDSIAFYSVVEFGFASEWCSSVWFVQWSDWFWCCDSEHQ